MTSDRRNNDRVAFERGFPATISSLDGKWRIPCAMDDVSDDGAKLTVKGEVDSTQLKEFLLLLSANGQAFRRCELSWIENGDIGVRFIKPDRRGRAAPASIRGATSGAAGSASDRKPAPDAASKADTDPVFEV